MCIDYGEMEIAQWLLDRGMDANVRAATDADGFGGHTLLDPNHGPRSDFETAVYYSAMYTPSVWRRR